MKRVNTITKIIKGYSHLFEVTTMVPMNLGYDYLGHLEIACTTSLTQHIHSHSQRKYMKMVIERSFKNSIKNYFDISHQKNSM